MTRFSYIFLISFLLIFLELLLESMGLRLMLFAPFVFYISYVFGAGAGCAAALIGGMTLDFCLGHTNPWSAVFLLAVVLFGRLWLRRMGSDSLNLLVIPGAVLPFLAQFPPTLIQSADAGFVCRQSFQCDRHVSSFRFSVSDGDSSSGLPGVASLAGTVFRRPGADAEPDRINPVIRSPFSYFRPSGFPVLSDTRAPLPDSFHTSPDREKRRRKAPDAPAARTGDSGIPHPDSRREPRPVFHSAFRESARRSTAPRSMLRSRGDRQKYSLSSEQWTSLRHSNLEQHGTPNGIRTRVTRMRTWCPRPLDDRGGTKKAISAHPELRSVKVAPPTGFEPVSPG